MIKLCDMNTRKFIDKFPSEFELIKAIEPTMSDDKRYLATERRNGGDVLVMGIRSIRDFQVYKADFNRRMILDKSCVELKRDMMDLVFSESKTKIR